MIGSTSRDYLLNNKIDDYDFVTDATPDEISHFLDVDLTFKKFGSVRVKFNNNKIDITTLRIEEDYKDYRHPNKIIFVKTIGEDYLRRDFTINAIYIDEDYNIIDPTNGKDDLLINKKLQFIGDPLKRIKEDPLRILRAKRFATQYNLKLDKETSRILDENKNLLDLLNKDKIIEEQRKLERVIEKVKNNE